MTHYLYIPVQKKLLSEKTKLAIAQWISTSNDKAEEVIVCYCGEKKLKDLPEKAKIYVLTQGVTLKPTPLARKIPSHIARSFSSLSTHLHATDGDSTILVPKIAEKMIEDGLFHHQDRNLRIKLFFCNAGHEAQRLAKAYFNALKKDARHEKNNIRLDYYPSHILSLPRKIKNTDLEHKYATPIHHHHEPAVRAHTIRKSIYNHDECSPKITDQQIATAITEYRCYKSSRYCGLSGWLGLNGLFSSDASTQFIRALTQHTISEKNRFILASQFVEKHPKNHFTLCLTKLLEESCKLNDLIWTDVQEAMALNELSLLG